MPKNPWVEYYPERQARPGRKAKMDMSSGLVVSVPPVVVDEEPVSGEDDHAVSSGAVYEIKETTEEYIYLSKKVLIGLIYAITGEYIKWEDLRDLSQEEIMSLLGE